MPIKTSTDPYTKTILSVIAFALCVLAIEPAISPTQVQAQISYPNVYIEPGTVAMRLTDGGTQGEGKMIVDLKTGDIWGFPTNSSASPYPVDPNSTKPPVSKPIYLGRFDFSQMK